MSDLFSESDARVVMKVLAWWPLVALVVGLLVGWTIGRLA